MRVLQMQGIDQLVENELAIPVPGPGEVLIKTTAATICTSDLHDLKTNPFGIQVPRVLGHEGAGVVVERGPGVKHLLLGTRVAAHPVVPCLHCGECKRGLEHLCANMGHLGYDRDGCFAEYFVHRADRVIPLKNEISESLGTLLEPVAVCLQAIARAGDLKGKTILVAGDGAFGNIIARLARRAGASRVWVSGREPFRLKMIPGIEIWKEDGSHQVDVAILAVSAAEAVQTCMNALARRGRLVLFSSLEKPVAIDLFRLHLAELEIVGACNDQHMIAESLECLEARELSLQDLITHQLPFERWQEAFSLARDRHDQSLKVTIVF